MAKKKVSDKQLNEVDAELRLSTTENSLKELQSKIDAILETLDNFRQSFKNQDQNLAILKERNRLR